MSQTFDDELRQALDALDAREVPPAAPGWDERVLAELAAPAADGPIPFRRPARRSRLRLLLAATLAVAAFAAFASGAAARIGFPDPFNGPLGPTDRAHPLPSATPKPQASLSSTPTARPSSSASPSPSPSPRVTESPPAPRPGLTATPVPQAGAADVGYSTGEWAPVKTGVGDDLVGVELLSPGRAWIAAAGGQVLRAHGSRWEREEVTPHSLAGVAFADRQHGWVCGADAQLLASEDGGVSWTSQFALAGGRLAAISVVDRTHAWAVGDDGLHGMVLATSDGTEWRRQDAGEAEVLRDVAFTDREHGVAVGYWGTLLRTTDGGLTWDSLRPRRDETYTSVCFAGEERGWVAGFRKSGYGARALLLATSDGGATWKRRCLGARGTTFADIVFADPLHGWAVAGYPKAGGILETTDGGATWRLQTVVRAPLVGIDYAGGKILAVGWKGLAFQTSVDPRKLARLLPSNGNTERWGPSGPAPISKGES